ncbi:hypothetical protein Tco_0648902 [Tanacetum coccineum]
MGIVTTILHSENGTIKLHKHVYTCTAEEKKIRRMDVKASAESLDSIFNRLQKIVSRLAILGVVIVQEDLNSNFLSSLPHEWNTNVVVWMNKPEVETISIDDLYNRVFQNDLSSKSMKMIWKHGLKVAATVSASVRGVLVAPRSRDGRSEIQDTPESKENEDKSFKGNVGHRWWRATTQMKGFVDSGMLRQHDWKHSLSHQILEF